MADNDVEVLARGSTPRWLFWGGGGIVIALAVALALLQVTAPRDEESAAPSPSTASSQPAGPTSAPAVVTSDDGVGDPLPPPGPGTPRTVAAVGNRLLVVGLDVLFVITRSGSIAFSGQLGSDNFGTPLVAVDEREQLVWVVGRRIAPTTVQAFDLDTVDLASPIAFDLPRRIDSATAIGGSLFVSGPGFVTRIDAGGRTVRVDLPPSKITGYQLAADPLRSRILAHSSRYPNRIFTVTLAGQVAGHRLDPPVLKATLGVTGRGAIWLAGFNPGVPVLVRLRPDTFAVAAVSNVTNQVGVGAILLAAGDRSLLVGSASGAAQTWCLDDHFGAAVGRWDIAPEVAALSAGGGFVLLNDQLLPLELPSACRG